MNSHMFLSLLGCHEMVAQYAALYRAAQGTVKPPGAAYQLHPGYFSVPKHLTSIDWLADHGAILHQVSTHALLTDDGQFIAEWTEPIVKACDFIRDACEHRHGMQGNLFATPLAFWLARQSVIDDEIVPGDLHLLRLCPSAWISDRDEAIFEKMPTVYGPVNLRVKKSSDGKTLAVAFTGNWHHPPGKIILHVPPLAGISKITVNGKRKSFATEIGLSRL